MVRLLFVVLCGGYVMAFAACCAFGAEENDADARAKAFIAKFEREIRPLETDAAKCWYAASLSGAKEDFARKKEAEFKLKAALGDVKSFEELKAIKENQVADPLLRREIDVIYREYLGNQIDKTLLRKIVEKTNAVEAAFNVFRAEVNGKKITDNEVRRILLKSDDPQERQAAWEASKTVGKIVESDLKELFRLRNEAAKQMGFDNFQAMQLYLNEQDVTQIDRLFDDLDAGTREPFRKAKAAVDAEIAAKFGIAPEEIQPWHYSDAFLQEPPLSLTEEQEKLYASVDAVEASRLFYAGIGLPIDDVLAKSDLYDKPGKSPHAYSCELDREGDVRIFANVMPGRRWLSTMLHESGHASYSKYVSRDLPYAVRTYSHSLTTEGIAMMFERFPRSEEWLSAMGANASDAPQFRTQLAEWRRLYMLFFSRWCQVMYRFERGAYENPDQDLNALWGRLVERYQLVKLPPGRNEPDYAAKMHIIGAPVYYHNYMLGDMFASQMHHKIVKDVLKSSDDPFTVYYTNKLEVGTFLIEQVFRPGKTLPWNELTKHATGEFLNAKAFAEDVREKK